MDFRKIALVCAKAADDKQAEDIVVMNVSRLTPLTDYFVICDAQSQTQMRAIVEAVEKALDMENVKIMHKEGRIGSKWILLDYGGIVVHIFNKDDRYFYNLERIWGDAKSINWKK